MSVFRAVLPIMAAVALALTAGSAAGQEWRTDFTRHSVPLEEIVSGGPPKDGIRAIDSPRFQSVRDADRWLAAREPVIVVAVGDGCASTPSRSSSGTKSSTMWCAE